jgi:tripartite-type tricarboxylate transporter receptor subunit TctC
MKLVIAALSVVMAGLPAGAATAEPWPDHPVRLIVPYPPGGNVDTAARVVANKLQETLKQPFIIENKAGAGGLIAGEMFAKSAPDGYTLFVGANGPVLFAPEIEKRDAYNWRRDFIPITSISMTPLVLEVYPSVPAKGLTEFLDLVRREPGKLTMASPGAGTTNHLLSELIQSSLDVKWLTVHYRGNAPATNDLIAGHVQFGFDQVSVALPFVNKGMVRALAITSSHRTSWLPDVPTFAELGYKDIDAQTFTGLFAPKDTSPVVVNRIHDVMLTVLHDPQVIEKFNAIGAETVAMKPAEFTDYLQRETDKWIPIVRKADIKAD